MAEKKVIYDVDGYDVVTDALLTLLNQYPAIEEGDSIAFSTLGEESGKAIFPVTGAVVENSKENIVGRVTQVCLYPFYVIYRESGLTEQNKIRAKEWLDNLGKWLEKQKVIVGGAEYRLGEYPSLKGDRKFLSISRQSPSYLDNTNENKVEDWAIHMSVRYQFEYDK